MYDSRKAQHYLRIPAHTNWFVQCWIILEHAVFGTFSFNGSSSPYTAYCLRTASYNLAICCRNSLEFTSTRHYSVADIPSRSQCFCCQPCLCQLLVGYLSGTPPRGMMFRLQLVESSHVCVMCTMDRQSQKLSGWPHLRPLSPYRDLEVRDYRLCVHSIRPEHLTDATKQ